METMALSLTASDRSVIRNIEQKPSTVLGIVNKLVLKVPNLRNK